MDRGGRRRAGAARRARRRRRAPPRAAPPLPRRAPRHVGRAPRPRAGGRRRRRRRRRGLAAAFFHDAVYDPTAHDNEEQSARLAERVLAGLGWSPARCAPVGALVRATATHEAADDDAAVLLDADLAVLGSDAGGVPAYVTGVRAEYAHLDEASWRPGAVSRAARPARPPTPLRHGRRRATAGRRGPAPTWRPSWPASDGGRSSGPSASAATGRAAEPGPGSAAGDGAACGDRGRCEGSEGGQGRNEHVVQCTGVRPPRDDFLSFGVFACAEWPDRVRFVVDWTACQSPVSHR